MPVQALPRDITNNIRDALAYHASSAKSKSDGRVDLDFFIPWDTQ